MWAGTPPSPLLAVPNATAHHQRPVYQLHVIISCGLSRVNCLLWLWISVEEVEADLAAQKVFVTSDKPQDELLAALKKTGKNVEYIGIAS